MRLIINLRRLNELSKYDHFKMDGSNTILNIITKYCYMATIDLKDAYYSVSISKYLQNFHKI